MSHLNHSISAPSVRLDRGRALGRLGPHPASFTLVMATGVVSVAANEAAATVISACLAVAAAAFYLVLVALAAVRFVRTATFVQGPRNLDSCLLLFSFVAASEVLAARASLLGATRLTALLLLVGLGGFASVCALVLRQAPARVSGAGVLSARGAWLLLVVALQSLAVVGSDLSAHPVSRLLTPLSVIWLVLGLFGYVAIVCLIARRHLFEGLSPSGFTPDYWITMGALAISALAATSLIGAVGRWSLTADLAEPLRIVAIVALIGASLWIPPLLVAETWKALRSGRICHRDRWSMVFPLGMYAVAAHTLGAQLNMSFLNGLAILFFWLALAAWILVCLGYCLSSAQALRSLLSG